jgi:hypothetical protein
VNLYEIRIRHVAVWNYQDVIAVFAAQDDAEAVRAGRDTKLRTEFWDEKVAFVTVTTLTPGPYDFEAGCTTTSRDRLVYHSQEPDHVHVQ